MNILFIAPRLPYPADTGGKIRTLNIVKQLAKYAKIHLACFSFDKNDKELSAQLENDGVNVTLIPIKEPNIIQKVTQVLFHSMPVSIVKYINNNMKAILTELNETNEFDVIHIDHLHMAHYQKCFDGIPCVMDEHNVEYKILERCANVEKSLVKRIVFRNQSNKMKIFEARQIKDFSAYLTVSNEDKDLLDDLGERRSSGYVIPNGVDTEYFRIQDTRHKTQEDALVFTGSMDWFPNNDAAVYFCNDILPLIWKTNPNVKFYIIGKEPSAALKEKAKSDRRIILTGRVDDVRPFVQKSKIFVVPLRIGGGTRLKILEAMSMEKAVLSTSIGAEGIDYAEDQNIVIADEPETFAQKAISLLDDKEKCKSLGKAGRKLVMEKYDWNIVGSKLVGIYEKFKVKK